MLRLAALALAWAAGPAAAANFNITTATTTAQTLAASQVGTITDTGSLTVSGATVAVGITGNNATLTNLGSLLQTGTGRTVRDNTGVTGLTVTNGSATNSTALMRTADADVIQLNVANGSILLNNYGSMISLNASAAGAQVIDFSAVTTGGTTVNNQATGLMQAFEADAVRTGVNGVVSNAGRIIATTATASSSDGIDGQNNAGMQITNLATGLIQGGRHGITGGALNATVDYLASITNLAGGVIKGDNGAGLNFDGFNAKQVVTVVNGGSIIGNGVSGDGDGVDVDGLVNITNTGIIRSVNAFSPVASGLAFSEAISVGGGTIVNSGLIEGLVAAGNSNAVGRGITLVGNDITTGPLAGTREAIYGPAVVTNNAGGVIRGQLDSAIVVGGPASGYTVTINNAAGATIQGGSPTAAAVRTGFDNDTINNSGSIDGSSSGVAIDMGGGDNTLNIRGGAAVILGNISGGTGGHNLMTIDAGAGNAFAYAGSLSNFDTVQVLGGTVTLSGVSSYTGNTLISGGRLVLAGANRLAGASGLVLNGGVLEVAQAAGVDGQTFASLALGGDTAIVLNGSALTFNALGTIAGGKTLGVTGAAGSPGYVFRVLGNQTGNAGFQTLLAGTTIDGLAATYRFDGVYTDVSAVPETGTLALWLAGLALVARRARRLGDQPAAGSRKRAGIAACNG